LTHPALAWDHDILDSSAYGEGDLFVTLEAYFDDSGDLGTDQYVAIGGWVARRNEWLSLSKAWYEALHEEFEVCYLHTADLMHRTDIYKEWNEEKKKRAINRFTGLCAQHLSFMVVSVVKVAEFDAVFNDERRAKVGNALVSAAMSSFALVETFTEAKGHYGRVNYFVERGSRAEHEIHKAFTLSFPDCSSLRSIAFVGKLWAGCQAADLATYEGRLSVDRTIPDLALRYPLLKMMRESKYALKFVQLDELQDLHRRCVDWPDL
jgi:hypothetical protein